MYEKMKGNLHEESPSSLLAKLTCGVIASVIGQIMIYFLDIVQHQIQVQPKNALVGTQYKRTLDGLFKIARE